MIEIGQRFDLENDLTKEIKHLEELGLWVFGVRQEEIINGLLQSLKFMVKTIL